ALTKQLKDEKPAVRWEAAFNLGDFGAKAKAAVPALIETLQDREKVVRMHAAAALGRIGPEAKPAVPDMIDLLGDKDWAIRATAALSLGAIGDRQAGPALTKALEDEHAQVRVYAAGSLWRIEADG